MIDWHNGHAVVRNAREIVLCALEQAGWKVVRLSNGNAYYTTSQQRTSTICLGCFDKGLWRWNIDRMEVRKRGTLKMIQPKLPDGRPQVEFTCAEEELMILPNWISRWVIARDGAENLPSPPVELVHRNVDWEKDNYIWTVLARNINDRLVQDRQR